MDQVSTVQRRCRREHSADFKGSVLGPWRGGLLMELYLPVLHGQLGQQADGQFGHRRRLHLQQRLGIE
jgi:hypothetical protein